MAGQSAYIERCAAWTWECHEFDAWTSSFYGFENADAVYDSSYVDDVALHELATTIVTIELILLSRCTHYGCEHVSIFFSRAACGTYLDFLAVS